MMEDMFEERITTSTAANCVTTVANRYIRAESALLRQMLKSPFIHVDDTKINIQGESNYVWVFTDGVHVVFGIMATRGLTWCMKCSKGTTES